MNGRILVVDDDEGVRGALKMTLEYEGYECLFARSGREGLDLLGSESIDLVLLDVKMPGMDGLEVLRRMRERGDAAPVIVISGHGTIGTAVEATKQGAFTFLEKGFEGDVLKVNIRNALEQHRLQTEVSRYRELAEIRHEMVGDSPALQEVTDAIGRAAPTSSTGELHP